jgi:hypothetical protein
MHCLKRSPAMPSPEKVSKALEQIRKRPANHDYFFARLSSPDWIEPLDAAGLFASPPAAVREGDTISFPFWPESQYLARMAGEAPDQVAAVMAKIPATDNVRVHEDLAKAAATLPSSLAAKWAKTEAAWVAQQEHLYFLLPEALGELVQYLANTGELGAALELARALLGVRVESWSYEQVLQKYMPSLVLRAGLDGLKLLCDLLDTALVEDTDEGADGEDYSWIWRPAIEPHEQNYGHGDIRDALVDAVRDNALALVEHGVDAHEVLRFLEERRHPIFKRIGLHLLREKHQALSEAAVQAATDKRNFADARVHHEYSRLLAAVFPGLDAERMALVLDWIDDGPKDDSSDDADPERRRKQKGYWQAQRLCGLRGALPDEWEKRYQDIVAEVGEPKHPDFVSYISSWTGPTSPKEAHELEQMSPNDIAGFLKTWQPTHAWQAPEPEGLGGTLQSVVGKSPERFVGSLGAFRDVDPTYARALVHGLNDAAKRGASIDWTETIQYLAWIAGQPRSIDGRTGGKLDQDPHWGWARKAAVSLLSVGFEKNAIDHSLRKQAWDVVDKIADDPDPTPDDNDKSSMDPATRSINTTRGEAMHAVIRYALWVRRGAEAAGPGAENVGFDMDSIPEVREQLERHLDPNVDPSPAVRAVFGQWFPWLVLLDRAWAERHVGTIFPDESPTLRDAAWGTYLAFCPVYNEPFELLRGQYSASVERLGTEVAGSSGWRRNPLERLGEHLLVMVGRGVLSWGDDNGLVRRFFENASTKVAAHAVAFVGRSLRNENQDVPREVVQRFQRLWDDLLGSIKESPDGRVDMLKTFGWWFASGRFEEEWAFDQLTEVLRASGGTESDFLVMEKLADIAPKCPQQALAVLKALVRRDQRGWNVFGWKDRARAVLQAGLGTEATRPEAEALIHELGAKGHLHFRDLLAGQRATAAQPTDEEA